MSIPNFSFLTIFISTITFTFDSLALYQAPRIPESKEEEEIAKSLHEQIFKNDLDEFIRILNDHPECTTITYYYPDYEDFLTPLHFAAILGRDEFIDELLKRNVDPSLKTPKKGHTVLHISPIPRIIQRFIDLGLNIEEPSNKSQQWKTPLLAQLYRKHGLKREVIHILLEAGADPNVNASGLTALHILFTYYMVRNQEVLLSILEDLLDHGARVEIRDKNGAIPLHLAAKKNNVQAIKILVDKAKQDRIDIVNIKDIESRNTPLFVAYLNRSRQAITELLRLGANPLLINKSLLSVNGEAHEKANQGSLFNQFVLDKIDKYFRPSDECKRALIKRQRASAYASN